MAIGIKVQTSGIPVLTFDKRALKKVLATAGREVAAQAKSYIKPGDGDGRKYPHHQASAPGESPRSLTGNLRKSIVVRPFKSGEGVAIRDKAHYAASIEHGATGGGSNGRGVTKRDRKVNRRHPKNQTRRLAPRPFLVKAMEAKRASIERRLSDAVTKGFAFARERVIRSKP